ncbi:hypothetical protein EGI26_16925 [Lacihabitans sp. CCS-44]|uniref:3-coathanger stack domain-containing protein n=1 Tax=Lacihabitans sp. CCS-44 TaxID=2487331 RepID=UPI0020CCA73A|nr:3-coathanger stack domain-containing protein [Lacihabitans sp. CCS-44]MCP9756850.1 hypothetical protein [Lacihabitans sp. CCS-44]
MKKLILLLLIGTLKVAYIFAQAPANDNCSGATVLTVNSDNLCTTTLTSTTVGATESQPGCNFTFADDDVWFKFTATATSHKIQVASNSGTLQNPVFEVFSGSCGSLSSLACVNNQNTFYDTERTILTSLTIGNEYFIRVNSGGNSAFSRGTFTICVALTVPPTNDDCAGAISLLVNQNQTCTLTNTGTSEEATLSMASCYSGSQADDDVWYEFTATSTVHKITLTPGTIKFPILEMFSGNCGGLTSLYCKPDFINNFTIGDLTVGQKYYLRVYSYLAGFGQSGTFTICINEGSGMPANDGCSGAIALTANSASCGVLTAGTLVNATGPLSSSCVTEPIRNDVWYKFTAPNAEMILKLLNTTFSSANMELFSGICGNLTSLACSVTSENFLSYSNFTIGQEYYLRVWDRYGSTGTFDLCLSSTLANDKSDAAVTLSVNSDFTCTLKASGDNTLALSNETSNSTCPLIKDGVWYKFAANNDSLTIQLTALGMGSNSRFELFHKEGTSLVFLESQPRKLFKTNFVIGDEYYVLVYTCNGYPPNRGTFELCVSNFPPPPANDRCQNALAMSVNPNQSCSLTTSGTTVNALAGESANCSGEVDDDVWYSFVATQAKHSISVTPGTLQDPVFQVYEGTCETLNELDCINNSSGQNTEMGKVAGLVIGNTYFVRVFSSNVGAGQGTFNICVNLPVPNEDCEDAIILTPGATCTPVSGTSAGVTTDTYDNCDFYKYGVYYKFTAAGSSQIIRLTKGTIQNVYIDVLQNNCGNINRVTPCGSPSNAEVVEKVVSGLTVGTEYLIWVNTEDIAEEGTFDICVLNTVPPTNDNCATAAVLAVNTGNVPVNKTSGTTLFASQSQVGCSGNADDDVWYSFTASQTSHRVFLQKIGTFENIILELFSGSCGSLVSKQCISSGFDNTKNSSALLTNLTAGETYFVRVYYQGTVPGSFSIAITSAPLNDNCVSAVTLNPSTADDFAGAVAGSSFDATLSSNSYFNNALTDDDVWYKFTATQKVHRIKLKGWKSDLGAIEVFKGTCGSLLYENCSPTFSPQCNSGSMSSDTLILTLETFVPGQTYFFRVYSIHLTANQSLFDVAVTSPYILPFDDCSGASSIPVAATSICTTPTIVNTKGFSTISGQSGGCNYGEVSGQPEKDIYLKFTATANQHKINLKTGQGGTLVYQLFSGTCGSLVSMGCSPDFDSVSYVGNLTIGQTYFIRVLMYYNNIETLKVCISTPVFVSNDECAAAISVVPSGDVAGCSITSGNLAGSSQTQFNECGVIGNSDKKIMRDVWYKFVANSTIHRLWFSNVSILKSGSSGPIPKYLKFEVFSGTCNAKTFLGCSGAISSQEEKVFNNLTVGETYFIRVSTYDPESIDFQFCIKNISPPANDVCATAINLTVFNSWSSLNYTKGTTLDANQTTGTNTCGQANSFDVWYKFTATNITHRIAFRSNSVQKAITGLTLAVYSGSCSAPVHIACKTGDFTSLSEELLNVTGLTIGQEYFVKVYASQALVTHQGGFELQVLNPTAPTNDQCSSPIGLSIQSSSQSFTSVTSETILSTLSAEPVACTVTGTADDDVWYSFTPTQTSVRLILSANFMNPVYVLYTGTCGGLTSVVCGSAGATATSLNKILTNLTANTPYLLRVYSSSNTLRGRVFVALTSDTSPPANDLCAGAVTLMPSANSVPSFTEGTTVNAKNDNTICFAGNEVWFKFVATATTHRVVYDGYLKDPAIIMFSGTCGSLAFVPSTCFGDIHNISFTKSGLTIGTTYFLKIAAQADVLANQGTFKIAIITPSVPVNDNCANALSLSVNSPAQHLSADLATNEFATSGCGSFSEKDVWFKFTATSAKMGVEVENLNANAIIGLYKGVCPSPSLIKCSFNSNQSSFNQNTLILDNLVVGDEYLIAVAARSGFMLEYKIKLYEFAEISQNTLYGNTCFTANLVTNPSFEDPQTCPTSFVPTPSAPGQWLSPNLGWTIPTTGSSDYFNSCADYIAAIETPRNTTFGIQTPRNGQGFAGLFSGGTEYREYLHTRLALPMEIGKRYLLSMYVSRSDYYGVAANNLGFGLNVTQKVEFTNDTIQVDKIILPSSNLVVHEKDNWVNIVAEITADQAYQHLYLGNFRSQANTISQLATDISGGASGGYGGQSASSNAYYFIDDVFVGEIANTIACGASNCNNAITLLSPTDDILGGSTTKQTNLELKANITIQGNANVLFQSNKSILMDATQGVFEVKNGVVFEAKIGGCVN